MPDMRKLPPHPYNDVVMPTMQFYKGGPSDEWQKDGNPDPKACKKALIICSDLTFTQFISLWVAFSGHFMEYSCIFGLKSSGLIEK